MQTIRVLLADDHAIVRDGLKALLIPQADIEVVAEAEDGREAVNKALQYEPDVVVMDFSMPGLNGLEGTRELANLLPQTKVIVLTMHDNEEYIMRCIQAGAAGYLLKDTIARDLIKAIHRVIDSNTFYSPSLSPEMLNHYIEQLQSGGVNSPLDLLTNREREILQLIAEGMTNKRIAQRLAISIKTVETHRAHIMNKLDIHDPAGLTRFAIVHGVINVG